MFKQLTGALLVSTLFAMPALAEMGTEKSPEAAPAGAASATAKTPIANLGETGAVMVSGKVSSIDSLDNEFTLTDNTGKIDVEQTGKLSVAVGDEVSVNGNLSKDMGEKEIAASKVTVLSKGLDKTSQNLN